MKLINFRILLLAGIVLLPAAVHPQSDKTMVNPVSSKSTGPSRYEVTCFQSARFCAEEFKRLCPEGHTVGGYFRNVYDHGQITASITCKETAGEQP